MGIIEPVDVSGIPVLEWLSLRQCLPNHLSSDSNDLSESSRIHTTSNGTSRYRSDAGLGESGQRFRVTTCVVRESKMTA